MSALGQKQTMRRNKSCPLYSQLRLQKRIFALRHVRFTPESGHVRRTSLCLLWAKNGHRLLDHLLRGLRTGSPHRAPSCRWEQGMFLEKIAIVARPASIVFTRRIPMRVTRLAIVTAPALFVLFVEYGIYRRPLRHAIHRAFDFSGRADGFRRGHHGCDRARRGRTLALCE